MKQGLTRRGLLNRGAAIAAGFAGLKALQGRAYAQGPLAGFGPLIPDPDGLLDLPKGFKYNLISRLGESVNNGGFRVPGLHDGMAALPGPDGLTVLVRNHEMGLGGAASSGSPYPTADVFNALDKSKVYDPGTQNPALGGTTNIVYDTRIKKVVNHYLTLTGTIRNCAGGLTPWGSWLTCEETTDRAGGSGRTKDHGYIFEVPSSATDLVTPEPLRNLGRFSHEAIAIDPETGIVYLTEDEGDSAFYRFVPDLPYHSQPEGVSPVDSLKFGKLQALKFVTRTEPLTHNRGSVTPFPIGVPEEVEWVDLTDVEALGSTSVRAQAHSKGALFISRGEGIWWGNEAVYFVSTDGGSAPGQLFKYTPSANEGTSAENTPGNRATLELFVQPVTDAEFGWPDNICVAPFGDILVCEDSGGANNEYVHGVTPNGVVYKIAHNRFSRDEFAGATFSPDGTTLFVNVQGPGFTFAITGPWQRRVA